MSAARTNPRGADAAYDLVQRVSVHMLMLNALLAIAKGAAGHFGHSYALTADALNNASDIGLSLAVILGIRWARRPPDRRHPFGHGRIETEVARIVGVVVLVVAGAVAYGAWKRAPDAQTAPHWPVIATAMVALVIKEGMYRAQRRIARKVGSLAVEADALNHRFDVGATGAVVLGTLAVRVGGEAWAFCDDVAAIAVSALMAYSAVRIIWQASSELLDEMPPDHVLDAVRTASTHFQDDGVIGPEKVIGRKMGLHYRLILHLEMRPEMSVRRAHELAHLVRAHILDSVSQIGDVVVPIEPAPGAETGDLADGP